MPPGNCDPHDTALSLIYHQRTSGSSGGRHGTDAGPCRHRRHRGRGGGQCRRQPPCRALVAIHRPARRVALPDPGGSTGHASNFVFPVDHSKEVTDLTVDSMRQYQQVGVLDSCGGIEVARSAERMQELTRRMTSAMSWGVEAELLSPAEIQQLVPYRAAGLLVGEIHTPTGAIVDPIRAGERMREHAHPLGALTVCADR